MTGLEIRVSRHHGIITHVGRKPRVEMDGCSIYIVVVEWSSTAGEIVADIDENDIVPTFVGSDTFHKSAL